MPRIWYLSMIFIATIIFSCGCQEDYVPKKTGRVIIKFCSRASPADKRIFFDKYGLMPIAYNIFGYDIVEWKNVQPDLKKEKSSFGCTVADSRQKIIIKEYEMENSRLRKLPFRNPYFLSKQGCLSDKEIANWPEKFIKTEDAHRFLKSKKTFLWPNGIVIADEGFDMSHPDIKPVLKYDEKNKPIYWINPKNKIWRQHEYHASLVSCLAAGCRNGKGIEGVAAPDSYILPLLIFFYSFDSSFYSDIAIGLAHFQDLERERKVVFNVVNMSFHIINDSKIIRAAIEKMSDKLFVTVAGNWNYGVQDNIDEKKTYPASWELPNIIVVAATDQDDKLGHFSNYGKKRVDISAPGKGVCSCQKGGYGAYNGTSFAAPLVSGALSLLFSIDPFMRPESAKQILLLGADERTDLYDSVRNGKRLNVYNSVLLAYVMMYGLE